MRIVRIAVVLFVAAPMLAIGAADEPPPEPSREDRLAPPPIVGWLRVGAAEARRLEFVEMASTILAHGAEMGPGTGWFHPAQTRFGWEWLAARMDADHDGALTREEFRGPADLFDRLDRDRDGAVTADDLDWSERSTYLARAGLAARPFRLLDDDSNGRVSRAEWDALFDRLAAGKDHLTPDDLMPALVPPSPRRPTGEPTAPPPAGPTRLALIEGLLKGEIGSPFEGPGVGRIAPDFALETHDAERRIALSEFRGKTPVVLVFGSFT